MSAETLRTGTMFSQNQEEQWIIDYFGDEVGTLLDLGANDGETLSNSRAAILRGWSGVLVEASPTAFSRLRSLYGYQENVELHNVAVCARSGKMILHESGPHLKEGDVGLLSTLVVAERDKWAPTTHFTPAWVECVTVMDLLKRSRFASFDLITMDIEGMDETALVQMDLTSMGVRMLIIENNVDMDFVKHLCYVQGLKPYVMNQENTAFVR